VVGLVGVCGATFGYQISSSMDGCQHNVLVATAGQRTGIDTKEIRFFGHQVNDPKFADPK